MSGIKAWGQRTLQPLIKLWRKINLRFFWQILLAFILVTLFTASGIFLVGQRAVTQTQDLIRRNPPPYQTLWADRLARYYRQAGSWEGIDRMIAGYPNAPEWGPWDSGWTPTYMLISPDGVVIKSSDPAQIGRKLRRLERPFVVPITVEGNEVGRLLLIDQSNPIEVEAPRSLFSMLFPEKLEELLGLPPHQGVIAERMLQTSLYVMVVALLATVIISRGISRPMMELTEATRAIAAGRLNVRVSDEHAGEIGELAEAFNHMAEALSHADTLRRNMTADVAHELRTPLSIIRGKLEGILDGVYPATPEQIAPVLEQTALLTHLVEDLRLLAEAEAEQLRLDLRPTDVADLIHDAYVNFTPQAEDRGIALSLDLPAELPRVQADWRRIAQVLSNLITNALRYTPTDGTVTLGAAAKPGSVEVTVSDTGSGIAPEDLPYVFDRFWRSDKSRSRSGGGTGLGLSIARQLIELHGGTITAESRPGHGATFRFTLPVASGGRG